MCEVDDRDGIHIYGNKKILEAEIYKATTIIYHYL